MQEDLFWLGFSEFPGIGPARFEALLKRFESAKAAWEGRDEDLRQVLGERLTVKFVEFRQKFSLTGFVETLERKRIKYLLIKDDNYPKLLKELSNAPFVLYVKGDLELVCRSNKTIAVVGTRKYSEYGKEVTELLTRELAENDFVIVSGLAIGIDSIAHQAAIEVEGKTIAVLGCGVDCCTPSQNQALYDKIVRHFGAVVSESAFGEAAVKGMFPARNRIIAGLSLGVLVTEGAEDSGALITAERAKELGRPVFAVPGSITSSLSIGPHKLLKAGAMTITNASDMIRALGFSGRAVPKKSLPKGETEIEQMIIELLAKEQLQFDQIAKKIGRRPAEVAAALSLLEVRGVVRSLSAGKYALN